MTSRERIEMGAIAACVALLLVLIPLNLFSSRKAKEKRRQLLEEVNSEQAQPLPAPTLSPQGPAMDEQTRSEQQEVLKQSWGENPFRPLEVQPASAQLNWILRGISVSPGKPPLAVINESIVQEGDVVDDHRVKRIEATRVILRKGERELILELPEEEASEKVKPRSP